VPKIKCKKQCPGYIYITNERYSIFELAKFVFVTLTNKPVKNKKSTTRTPITTDNQYTKDVQEQIYIKCNLKQSSFTYCLCCFIVVTKDDKTLIVKPMRNNQYAVYNNDKKSYEPLTGYQFDDFIAASATNIVLCYKTDDMVQLNTTFTPSTLDMEKWAMNFNLKSNILTENFNKYMSSFIEPLKIGPYKIKSSDILQLIEPTFELNDELLNAHLAVTTTLSNDVILFDSIEFAMYYHRGFKKSSEFLDKLWFKRNIVLIPVHHLSHWFIFIIDITRKTILLFDPLPSTTRPYQTYQNTIVQLLRTHHFYVNKSTLDFNDWKIINDFSSWKQDDNASCGIHCALFARSYVTSTKYETINKTNIKTFRTKFALHLLQYKKK
jgi:hypothetical protein